MTPSTQHEHLERRRGVALSIASVCIIITTIFFWGFMARWENDQVLINHTYEVIEAASRVLVDTSQLQSAARGVIITNQQKARTSFQAVRSRIVTDSQRLRTLTADNPRQQRRLDDLDLLIGKKIEFNQREFDLLTAQGFEAVKAVVLSGEGEKHAQLIDANIESILGEEYGLLSVREGAFKRTSYLTAATATILSGIAIVFFLIAKKIIRKEESLLKQTRDEAVGVADQLKVSQNSLLKSHERLMNFIEYSPTPLAMFDNEMRYLRASRRWFSEFHLDGAEIYGRSHYEVFPEFGEKWKSVHRRALAGETIRTEQEEFHRANGSVQWLRWEVQPWYSAKGIIGGIIIYAQDISSLKKAEADQKKFEQRLQESQKLESLGILAGGIAHDFNNILTGILMNASMGMLDTPPESEIHKNLDGIKHASLRAAELCRQMLAYAGVGRTETRKLTLNALVDDSLRLLERKIGKSVSLRLELDPNLPEIEADPIQIQQVAMNVILNASEAIGEKDGIISISTGVSEQKVSEADDVGHGDQKTPSRYAYLEVSDSGCGMSPEILSKIFDPFFSTKFAGRGLGLAAVSGIVRGHKGEISVKSDLGRGTTFRVLFPCGNAKTDKEVAQTSLKVPWHGEGCVLVVDDEEMVRKLAALSLQRLGYTTVVASTGRVALDLFRENPKRFALVLLDLTMPGLSGLEVLRELQLLLPDVKVVIMTGYSVENVNAEFTDARPAGFLPKPFQVEELAAILKQTLSVEPGYN